MMTATEKISAGSSSTVTPLLNGQARVNAKINGHDAPKAQNTAPDEPQKPKSILLRRISDIVAEQREPEWLLYQILEAKVLAVLAGPRGTFKSFVALHWAMRMALAGHAGVILSGEGAGLDRRVAAWLQQHGPNVDLQSLPLVALERALNLNSIVELDDLREAISLLPTAPKFVVIDTFSKFSCGLDENDNSKVAAFLSAISNTLREELGCAVLIVAHSGHGDVGRPRGASTLMSNPDCEYIVQRPDPLGMMVSVTRERFKDSPSLPPLGYEAALIDLGRLDSYGQRVTSLALKDTEAPPTMSAKKAFGGNQEKGLVALKEWARNHPDNNQITSIEMTAIFKTQGIQPKRRTEVLNSFVNARILSPAVGGHTLHRDNL